MNGVSSAAAARRAARSSALSCSVRARPWLASMDARPPTVLAPCGPPAACCSLQADTHTSTHTHSLLGGTQSGDAAWGGRCSLPAGRHTRPQALHTPQLARFGRRGPGPCRPRCPLGMDKLSTRAGFPRGPGPPQNAYTMRLNKPQRAESLFPVQDCTRLHSRAQVHAPSVCPHTHVHQQHKHPHTRTRNLAQTHTRSAAAMHATQKCARALPRTQACRPRWPGPGAQSAPRACPAKQSKARHAKLRDVRRARPLCAVCALLGACLKRVRNQPLHACALQGQARPGRCRR